MARARRKSKPIEFNVETLANSLTAPTLEELTVDEQTILAQQLNVARLFKGFFSQLAPMMQEAIANLDLATIAEENPEKFTRIMKDWATIMTSILEMERKVAALDKTEHIVQIKSHQTIDATLNLANLSDDELLALLEEKSEQELTDAYMDELRS